MARTVHENLFVHDWAGTYAFSPLWTIRLLIFLRIVTKTITYAVFHYISSLSFVRGTPDINKLQYIAVLGATPAHKYLMVRALEYPHMGKSTT